MCITHLLFAKFKNVRLLPTGVLTMNQGYQSRPRHQYEHVVALWGYWRYVGRDTGPFCAMVDSQICLLLSLAQDCPLFGFPPLFECFLFCITSKALHTTIYSFEFYGFYGESKCSCWCSEHFWSWTCCNDWRQRWQTTERTGANALEKVIIKAVREEVGSCLTNKYSEGGGGQLWCRAWLQDIL